MYLTSEETQLLSQVQGRKLLTSHPQTPSGPQHTHTHTSLCVSPPSNQTAPSILLKVNYRKVIIYHHSPQAWL